MAKNIVTPLVSQHELEDLLIQAHPVLDDEDDVPSHLTDQLRGAVESMLLAYRQSIYLGRVSESIGPYEQRTLSELISSNYRLAFDRASSCKPVEKAFHLFIQNMQTEIEEQIDKLDEHDYSTMH